MIPLMVFASPLVKLFNNEAEVLYYGTMFLRILSPFYMLCCLNQIYASTLRGLGDTKAPMFIMLGSFVVFRQIYLFTVSRVFGTLLPVAFGYPAGWLMCSLIITIYYRRSWKKNYT